MLPTNFVTLAAYDERIYNLLKNDTVVHGHYRVFRKNELLDRWHYKHNKRVPPIFLLADEGYAFQDIKQAAEKYSKENNFKGKKYALIGLLGIDFLEQHIYFGISKPWHYKGWRHM